MNYIKHLNKAMQELSQDDRLHATHIALYYALFQQWNESHFRNPMPINRYDIMKSAKISSLSTYTKCLRDLHECQYLEYHPSHNPAQGSTVYLFDFCTTDRTTSSTTPPPTPVQPPYKGNTNKETKEKEIPPPLDQVVELFAEQKFPEKEAHKFFNHFQSNGWKVGGKAPMKDWRAAARNWMLNTEKFKVYGNKSTNLHSESSKNYSEPL